MAGVRVHAVKHCPLASAPTCWPGPSTRGPLLPPNLRRPRGTRATRISSGEGTRASPSRAATALYPKAGPQLSLGTILDQRGDKPRIATGFRHHLHVLHADETPITMRLEDGKGTKNGYAWGWRNLRRPGEPSRALVEFRTSRGRDGPKRFLGDWSGTLIVDGYAGYDEVIRENDIERAGCWAHARRKAKDALDTGSESVAPLLGLMQELFAIERPINEDVLAEKVDREQQLELRRAAREGKSRQAVEAIYAEVDRLEGLRSTLPKSKLGKALAYLRSQRDALSVFLDDPRVPIHNNDSERDLRHLAVGRKNWLVFGSQRGGEVACRLYSLVLSCRQCGADPEAYLEDVLMKVATTPASEIASLTPWAWQAARTAS